MNSFRKAHGQFRGFAGVKRLRLAESQNRTENQKNRIGNGFKADSYANPMPSFRFGQVAKINKKSVQNRNTLLVRRWCSGHLIFLLV